jgi:hypothetical protein
MQKRDVCCAPPLEGTLGKTETETEWCLLGCYAV